MRSIAFNIVIFCWCISLAGYGTEEMFLKPWGIDPVNIQGQPLNTRQYAEDLHGQIGRLENATLNPTFDNEPIDRISLFSTGGYSAIWDLIQLVSTYNFATLLIAYGVPLFIVLIFEGIFWMAVIILLIRLIRGVTP